MYKAAVPLNGVSCVHFVEIFSALKYLFTFPHLSMLELNEFCFTIHTRVDNIVTFPNIYGLHVV